MKRIGFLFILFFLAGTAVPIAADAQCSICTRTAQQMGEKPARGLNGGIIYLAAAPMLILGIVGYTFWRRNGQSGG